MDSEEPGSLIDLAAVIALGAEIAENSGDGDAASTGDAELLTLPLPAKGLVGRFRKRFATLILKRLERALTNADQDTRARGVLHALQLGAASPSIDLSAWKQRAMEMAATLPSNHEIVENLRNLVE